MLEIFCFSEDVRRDTAVMSSVYVPMMCTRKKLKCDLGYYILILA